MGSNVKRQGLEMNRELLRLILLDDEAIILEGLLKTYDWNGMGYEVAGAYLKAEDALEELKATRPQVILSDIKMKNMDGLEFMRRAKEIFPDCIGILISAYKDFEYAQQACEIGISHYLLKPFTEERLAEVMQKAYCSYMESKSFRVFKSLYSVSDTKAADYLYRQLQESIEEDKKGFHGQTGGYHGYIRQALEYMETNYCKEDLSISMVADEIGLNPVYFGRIFMKGTGISFRRYLLNMRMEKAQKLLKEHKCSIVEVGAAVGIGNPSYFTQLFKQHTGKLPSEFV